MLPSKNLAQFVCVLLFILITTSYWTVSLAKIPKIRGVSLLQLSLYQPKPDNTWDCIDKSKTIQFDKVNDDYCDCVDGSDEPGTSACDYVFHCINAGHHTVNIDSSKVNDGICDCCDGSDEFLKENVCPNSCALLSKLEKERYESLSELHKQGAAKRSEMVDLSKQLKEENQKRRSELLGRINEQNALKVEKMEIKKRAETAESEAIDYFKQKQKEKDEEVAATAPTADNSLVTEASENFIQYDKNKDGFVDVKEVQVDMQLDRDGNGVVTVEEAKYFLDEREQIDLDTFTALSWPRIKTMRMKTQGLFTPPGGEQEADEVAVLVDEEHRNNQKEEDDDQQHEGDEESEDTYEEEDVGAGSVEPEKTNEVEYDSETQHFINMATEARNALAEVERAIGEISNEINEIDKQDAIDYGPKDAYATLNGECYQMVQSQYVYKLCPFARASQQQRDSTTEITLGHWDQWLDDDGHKYIKQKYANGSSCWNGPQRTVVVKIYCGLESKLISVHEPNRCEYIFDFETPAACDEANEQRLRDEL